MRPKSGQRCKTTWMQTSGTALLAVERCSLARTQLTPSVNTGWNKAGHPLPCGKSSATLLTCVFSSQHFSSYPASSRSDVPSLCPASITSRYDIRSMPGPRARASSSRSQRDTHSLRWRGVSLHAWAAAPRHHRVVKLCRGIEPTVITSDVNPISAREAPLEVPRWFHAVEVTATGPSARAICGQPISADYIDVSIPWELGHAPCCERCMLVHHRLMAASG